MALLYIEVDGRVFLKEKDGKLTFPEESEKLKFKVRKIIDYDFNGQSVWLCDADLDHFPDEWMLKDDVLADARAEKVVKEAIARSFIRPVVGAIVLKDGKVLMLKASRGFMQDKWNFPGGFMIYGEDPKEAIKREIREELGVGFTINSMLGVYSHIFERHGYHILCFVFLGALEGEPKPSKKEISKAEWIDMDKAMKESVNPFVSAALTELNNVLKYVGMR